MQEFKKKIHGSGTTALISNKEMNDIIKIVQALEDSNILLKGVTKAVKNKTREQREEHWFFPNWVLLQVNTQFWGIR